ncbi:MAG: asparagine synthase (glutamine-hydrolyzing) [Elusimicrobia bacterium]|nr:asparagine synthase (glutamine-hydrolyzing) [Elusimicrobiota bacterium]
MCGLAGIINIDREKADRKILADMQASIVHRGPDSRGSFVRGNVGLAHNRLAVIDPCRESDQPMVINGRYAIVYNGTVYNYRELREELKGRGCSFRTNSDTEAVLYSYIVWGNECVEKFNGVFSIAVYDRKKKELFLARDRYGAKPLYYYHDDKVFLFGSELKTFTRHPRFRKRVDLCALKEYFAFQNVFSERTLLEGVKLLPQGHRAVLDTEKNSLKISRYWDFDFSEKLDTDYKSAVNTLKNLLDKAITGQLVSDVPLGSYLSGGMDSSTLVAVSSGKLPSMPTFTGGFYMKGIEGREAEFDEREKAEQTANYFRLPNYQVIMNPGTMPGILDRLVYYNDDLRVGQCWQNFTAAHLASRFVKVVLCGAGGDELFGGYPWRYGIAGQSDSEEDFEEKYFSYWQRMVREEDMAAFFAPGIYGGMKDYSLRDVYGSVFRGAPGEFRDRYDKMFYFELKTFLQGLLLVEDKLSMAHGMETRVPFLDNSIVDFAVKLPHEYKIDDSSCGGKKILREAQKDLLPVQVYGQKKQGFSPPDENWYRNETAGYIRGSLLGKDTHIYDYIDRKYIGKVLEEHISGVKNNRLLIWSLLNFNLWLKGFTN